MKVASKVLITVVVIPNTPSHQEEFEGFSVAVHLILVRGVKMIMIRHGWHMKDAGTWRAFVGWRIYTQFSFGHAALIFSLTITVEITIHVNGTLL